MEGFAFSSRWISPKLLGNFRKARENPDSDNPEADIAKREELLNGLRLLRERKEFG
jgi:hypothetical protein